MAKIYLSPQEAVAAGYFRTVKTAANLRSARRGPPYFRPGGGGVVYHIDALEAYIRARPVKTDGEPSGGDSTGTSTGTPLIA